MTVLSAQSIEKRIYTEWYPIVGESGSLQIDRLLIDPYISQSERAFGMSYGLTAAGYDIRIGSLSKDHDWQQMQLKPGEFWLCSSLEEVAIPTDLQVIVHDKSTLARRGLALQNTVLEPGWRGHITLELSNHGSNIIPLHVGMPIAQLIFHQLDAHTLRPYEGKYQNQGAYPVEAIHEEEVSNG